MDQDLDSKDYKFNFNPNNAFNLIIGSMSQARIKDLI